MEINNPYWSNCLVEGLKAKFNDWSGVKLIPIWHGLFHFHVMWHDKKKDKVFHFTHKSLDDPFTTLWFRGRIEKVEKDGLRKWCKNHNAITTELP